MKKDFSQSNFYRIGGGGLGHASLLESTKGQMGHEPPEENCYDANSRGYQTSSKVTVNHRSTASLMLENTFKIIELDH